jgi:hypothetical protein
LQFVDHKTLVFVAVINFQLHRFAEKRFSAAIELVGVGSTRRKVLVLKDFFNTARSFDSIQLQRSVSKTMQLMQLNIHRQGRSKLRDIG